MKTVPEANLKVREREWTDSDGTHVEFRATSPAGLVYSKKVTKAAGGWIGRDEARASVIAAAAVPAPPRNRVPNNNPSYS